MVSGATASLVKMHRLGTMGSAPAANVRARIGPSEAYAYLHTINTPAPNVEAHGERLIPAQCYISPAGGTPNVWLQVIGRS